MFNIPNSNTKNSPNISRKKINLEITPMVRWGGLLLLSLALYMGFERTSGFVDNLELEVNALRAKKSGLLNISEAPDVTEHIARLSNQIEQLEQRYFDETTVGLNAASLQTFLAQTLSECGMENLSISLKTKASDKNPLSGFLIASVKGRDPKKTIAACLSSLRSSPYAFEIISLNWVKVGTVQMELKSFYLPSGTE